MSERLRSAWLATLAPLLATLAACLVAGLLLHRVWELVALGALGIVAWHYWRMHGILEKMAQRRSFHAGARVPGIWNELEHLLARQQREVRGRKVRLVAMLRAYRAAAAALPDAVIVMDHRTRRAVWFNEAAEKLLAMRHPADLGSDLAEHLKELSVPGWLDLGAKAEPLLDEQLSLNPGTHLSFKLIPYSEDHWLLIVRDVTKLMHLEQMRRDFVANVSHELRTPLTVLHGYLDLLDPEDDDETSRMFREMRRQSGRMAQLVEDLLTLSRLEAQEPLRDEHVAMRPMLAALRREAEGLSRGRHVIRVLDEAGLDLWGSEKELHSAFSNLVSNAVRYTPAGGNIEIRFAHEGEGAQLSVRDSGYGIPAAHLPRITERFYRVSTSRSRETGGTGLGLSIVKHVLNHHGARLDIASDVGKGSTFTCHFARDRVTPRVEALA